MRNDNAIGYYIDTSNSKLIVWKKEEVTYTKYCSKLTAMVGSYRFGNIEHKFNGIKLFNFSLTIALIVK